MSKFVVNEDMFGRYCRIKTDFSENMHIYKIVSLIESNNYCDVPLYWNSEPTSHKDMVPVLLVIHCGIDETKVQRVALSDCKVHPIANNAETKHGQWIVDEEGFVICSECGEEHMWDEFRPPYCDMCGAKMDGERKDEE